MFTWFDFLLWLERKKNSPPSIPFSLSLVVSWMRSYLLNRNEHRIMTNNYSLLPEEFKSVSFILLKWSSTNDFAPLVAKSLSSIVHYWRERIVDSNWWKQTTCFTSHGCLYDYFDDASKIEISSEFMFQSNCHWPYVSLSNFVEIFHWYSGTPVCGLRPLNRTSPPLMHKLTEILRPILDGIRKQHILGITMIFYKKTDLNTVKFFS